MRQYFFCLMLMLLPFSYLFGMEKKAIEKSVLSLEAKIKRFDAIIYPVDSRVKMQRAYGAPQVQKVLVLEGDVPMLRKHGYGFLQQFNHDSLNNVSAFACAYAWFHQGAQKGDPLCQYYFADMLYKKGKTEEAQRYFKKAFQPRYYNAEDINPIADWPRPECIAAQELHSKQELLTTQNSKKIAFQDLDGVVLPSHPHVLLPSLGVDEFSELAQSSNAHNSQLLPEKILPLIEPLSLSLQEQPVQLESVHEKIHQQKLESVTHLKNFLVSDISAQQTKSEEKSLAPCTASQLLNNIVLQLQNSKSFDNGLKQFYSFFFHATYELYEQQSVDRDRMMDCLKLIEAHAHKSPDAAYVYAQILERGIKDLIDVQPAAALNYYSYAADKGHQESLLRSAQHYYEEKNTKKALACLISIVNEKSSVKHQNNKSVKNAALDALKRYAQDIDITPKPLFIQANATLCGYYVDKNEDEAFVYFKRLLAADLTKKQFAKHVLPFARKGKGACSLGKLKKHALQGELSHLIAYGLVLLQATNHAILFDERTQGQDSFADQLNEVLIQGKEYERKHGSEPHLDTLLGRSYGALGMHYYNSNRLKEAYETFKLGLMYDDATCQYHHGRKLLEEAYDRNQSEEAYQFLNKAECQGHEGALLYNAQLHFFGLPFVPALASFIMPNQRTGYELLQRIKKQSCEVQKLFKQLRKPQDHLEEPSLEATPQKVYEYALFLFDNTDYEHAEAWFQKAAAQGIKSANFYKALIIAERGGKENAAHAIALIDKALEHISECHAVGEREQIIQHSYRVLLHTACVSPLAICIALTYIPLLKQYKGLQECVSLQAILFKQLRALMQQKSAEEIVPFMQKYATLFEASPQIKSDEGYYQLGAVHIASMVSGNLFYKDSLTHMLKAKEYLEKVKDIKRSRQALKIVYNLLMNHYIAESNFEEALRYIDMLETSHMVDENLLIKKAGIIHELVTSGNSAYTLENVAACYSEAIQKYKSQEACIKLKSLEVLSCFLNAKKRQNTTQQRQTSRTGIGSLINELETKLSLNELGNATRLIMKILFLCTDKKNFSGEYEQVVPGLLGEVYCHLQMCINNQKLVQGNLKEEDPSKLLNVLKNFLMQQNITYRYAQSENRCEFKIIDK